MTTGQPDAPAPPPKKPDQQAASGGDNADAVLARLRADCNWEPDPLGRTSTAPHARTWFQQREEQLKKDLPTGQDYAVQAGDSMGDIAYRAVRHDMKPEDFAKLSNKDLIKAEQEMQKRIVEAKANQKYFPCGGRPDLVKVGWTLTIPPAETAAVTPPSDTTPHATTPAATATPHDAGKTVKTPQQLADEWSKAFKATVAQDNQTVESFYFDPEAYAIAMKDLKVAAVQAYNQGGKHALLDCVTQVNAAVRPYIPTIGPILSLNDQGNASVITNTMLISKGTYDKIKDPSEQAQFHPLGISGYYSHDLMPPETIIIPASQPNHKPDTAGQSSGPGP